VLQIRNQPLLEAIALVIRQLRYKRGISQERFYEDTGILISRIELAQVNVSVSTLAAICLYFDISIKDFFNRVEKEITSH
jgi:transcriptional regulator with XRE-family HTH domain